MVLAVEVVALVGEDLLALVELVLVMEESLLWAATQLVMVLAVAVADKAEVEKMVLLLFLTPIELHFKNQNHKNFLENFDLRDVIF
jgi:hypothetical protein